MRVDVAIVGGTGVGDRLAALGGRPLHVATRAGMARGRLIDHEGLSLLLVSRHSAGHKTPPHLVNYVATALAVQQMGARACLATAAVGSLRSEWAPGTFVVCSDFLDFTGRNITLFDRQVVHRDFGSPFGSLARGALISAAKDLSLHVEAAGVYLGANGPRYETPQEIRTFKMLGADLVGMTASSEAIAMREAQIEYGCLAIVTNLGTGMTPETLDHAEVVDEMDRSGEKAVRLLLAAAEKIAERP